MNCRVWEAEGIMCVGLWFGAPLIHRMFGLSFARHWYGGCAHVHLSNHFRIIESGALLKFPT